MKRIVFNGRLFAQDLTGVQRYGAETLRAVDELIGRDPRWLARTRWQLALPHQVRELPLLENFEIQTLPWFGGHLWEQLSLAAYARGACLVNSAYSGPLFMRRQLVTLHDAAVMAEPDTYSWRYRAWHALMVAGPARHAASVMTVSRFSAAELKHRLHLERDDIVLGRLGWEHVMRRGTSLGGPAGPTRPGVDDGALLARHGLESGRFLLAVGSLKPSKNFGLIARALRLLDGWTLPVAVAGSGDPRLYRAAGSGRRDARGADDEPAAHPALRWLGAVSDEELFTLYRHAAWFVFPSRYEGFGLPALEAMALGCPVLAARAAAIPEVCGDAALYFDPHDPASLAALLRDVTASPDAASLRRTLAARARARLAIYRWEFNAAALLERLAAMGAVEGVPADAAGLPRVGCGATLPRAIH